ncbi:hypothetical protein HYZ97_02240 [Candidatus Pacearchaeota archaeon]|nr:hypothetical protein [Candidatus Pacearchaeota archaeon]
MSPSSIMQTKFKRHQSVTILQAPDPEYVEYYGDAVPIIPGMHGRINILLPNGQYHVEILDEHGELLAYAPFNEEQLEARKEA